LFAGLSAADGRHFDPDHVSQLRDTSFAAGKFIHNEQPGGCASALMIRACALYAACAAGVMTAFTISQTAKSSFPDFAEC
jgi:hypothetical protein